MNSKKGMKKGNNLIKIENECVDCPKEIGCIGDLCPYKNVTRYYCDNCGNEDILYRFDNKELCLECVKEILDKEYLIKESL